MADSSTVRAQRKRAHDRGDHSLCKVENCGKGARLPRRPPAAAELADPEMPASWGPTLRAAVESISSFAFMADETDPRFLVGAMTVRLAKAFDAKPAAAIGAQMASNVKWMLGCADEQPDEVTEVQSAARTRKAQALMAALVATA
jgi:hypothetical protein